MSLLTKRPPETVSIGGQVWPIETAFYIWVEFELIMQDPDLTDAEKIAAVLSLCFDTVPADINGALEGLLWFYRCGKEPESSKVEGGGSAPKKAYCFEQDAELIYASFMAAYGIDLNESDMHWWKFRALFRGLPQESEIMKVMGYRTADLKGLSKAQKKVYEKLRKIYALKNKRSVESVMSLRERDQRMKDYVARRFEEAGVTD